MGCRNRVRDRARFGGLVAAVTRRRRVPAVKCKTCHGTGYQQGDARTFGWTKIDAQTWERPDGKMMRVHEGDRLQLARPCPDCSPIGTATLEG